MRIKTRGALLSVLFCAVAGPFVVAQERPASRKAVDRIINKEKDNKGKDTDLRQKPEATRPVNFSEGLAILGAALESRHRGKGTSDCSHFAQAIYERAGFLYSYANSSELYAGIDEFRQVASPQPGDLAVWRGHVGIVVNPVQHSFFSLLRSGRGVEAYDSPYWKRRGRPRFFRYLQTNSVSAFSAPVGTANLEPTSLGIGPGGRAAGNMLPAERQESVNGLVPSERPLEAPALVATVFVPVANSGKPGADQLRVSLLKAFGNSEQVLRTRDLFTLTQSLIAFDQFEVKTVRISGNQGWAEVQIHEIASLAPGEAKVSRLWERQRWSLRRRDKSGWELILPQDTVYLPHDLAVRILAHGLANLADSGLDSANVADQKARLARLLDSLLENTLSSKAQ
jgi:hypothetical protein